MKTFFSKIFARKTKKPKKSKEQTPRDADTQQEEPSVSNKTSPHADTGSGEIKHSVYEEVSGEPADQNSHENFVNSVVKGLTRSRTPQEDHYAGEETYNGLSGELSENVFFPEVEIEEETEKKIKELESLTQSIDERRVTKTPLDAGKKYRIDYMNDLNERQLAAVAATEIPLLVIAGAGSGKTRVITYKVSYLIEKGVNPAEIVLLTFTKKAANEMLGRVEELLAGKYAGNVLGGTFHSFSNHMLKKYGHIAGVPRNFSIIDTEDTADIIDLLKTELQITGRKKGVPFPKKSKIQKIISKSKNLECSIENVLKRFFSEHLEYLEEIKTIAGALEVYKRESNLMDYDDLMTVLRDKLKTSSLFREKIRNSVTYILVDEYHDTNNIQREIVELITGQSGRITVVGDDSQCIYAFRGANFENILRFPQSFAGCGIVKLEENYRSDQGILNFANDIIVNAKIGFKKELYSQRFTGKKPVVKRLADATCEAEHIVDKVLEISGNSMEYSNFAVLTRAGWQSNYIQTELTKRKIPFVVVGGIKFSERRHVKDIVAFIKIVLNPLDAVSWHRVLKLIEGIGKVRAKEIVDAIHKKNGTIDLSEFSKRKYYGELKKLQDLFSTINGQDLPVHQIIDILMEYYKPVLKQIEDEFENRLKDLEVFSRIAKNYDSLEKFIVDFTLEPPSNKYQDETAPLTETEGKPLVVSTIHSAKGLEWHTVFIPFALDGLLPSSRSMGSIEELEEERRLFYVAASRAKENLFITMPSYVPSWDAVFTKPSRFIYEIDKNHYLVED